MKLVLIRNHEKKMSQLIFPLLETIGSMRKTDNQTNRCTPWNLPFPILFHTPDNVLIKGIKYGNFMKRVGIGPPPQKARFCFLHRDFHIFHIVFHQKSKTSPQRCALCGKNVVEKCRLVHFPHKDIMFRKYKAFINFCEVLVMIATADSRGLFAYNPAQSL
jgi:hypothetical protein